VSANGAPDAKRNQPLDTPTAVIQLSPGRQDFSQYKGT
jgi:hypothetical protein